MKNADRARRERLDRILVDRGLAPNRSVAQALILAGRVRCGTTRLVKPGVRYAPDVEIRVEGGRRYVSRGGYKLRSALEAFEIPVEGRDCMDVGASTGGFTQVLLEAGARRVMAIDVGRGQLDWKLRNDARVAVVEGVNARELECVELPFTASLAVVDVSFISLELVLPPIVARLRPPPTVDVVTLVKPQFEVGRGQVGRGGIVRDPALHRKVLRRFIVHTRSRGWGVLNVLLSPLTGADGNREFLLHLQPESPGREPEKLDRAMETAITSPAQREIVS